jgi:hypothetical protein
MKNQANEIPGSKPALRSRANAMLMTRFAREVAKNGARAALAKACHWLAYKVRSGLGILDPVYAHRMKLARQLDITFNSTVRYGPFAGLHLPDDSWWGYTSRGAMLLGIYELEVLRSLTRKPSHYRVFIDVGAADGYYALGALVSGLFDRTYCFEASAHGRTVIQRGAVRNKLENQVVVLGSAHDDYLQYIQPEHLGRAVMLIDIEGGEFDLLTRANLERLRHTIVFIELHEWRLADGAARLQQLLDNCRATHWVTELTTASRDLSGFPELREMSDTDRWLVCSEGRDRLMSWLRLDPRQGSTE